MDAVSLCGFTSTVVVAEQWPTQSPGLIRLRQSAPPGEDYAGSSFNVLASTTWIHADSNRTPSRLQSSTVSFAAAKESKT